MEKNTTGSPESNRKDCNPIWPLYTEMEKATGRTTKQNKPSNVQWFYKQKQEGSGLHDA